MLRGLGGYGTFAPTGGQPDNHDNREKLLTTFAPYYLTTLPLYTYTPYKYWHTMLMPLYMLVCVSVQFMIVWEKNQHFFQLINS